LAIACALVISGIVVGGVGEFGEFGVRYHHEIIIGAKKAMAKSSSKFKNG